MYGSIPELAREKIDNTAVWSFFFFAKWAFFRNEPKIYNNKNNQTVSKQTLTLLYQRLSNIEALNLKLH